MLHPTPTSFLLLLHQPQATRRVYDTPAVIAPSPLWRRLRMVLALATHNSHRRPPPTGRSARERVVAPR